MNEPDAEPDLQHRLDLRGRRARAAHGGALRARAGRRRLSRRPRVSSRPRAVTPWIALGVMFQGLYLVGSIGLVITKRTTRYPIATGTRGRREPDREHLPHSASRHDGRGVGEHDRVRDAGGHDRRRSPGERIRFRTNGCDCCASQSRASSRTPRPNGSSVVPRAR